MNSTEDLIKHCLEEIHAISKVPKTFLNMNINYSNFCFLEIDRNNNYTAIFFNDKKSINLLNSDKLIHKVSWFIKDGLLYIEGKEDEVHFTWSILNLSELSERPRECDIKCHKDFKIFGKTFFKGYEYIDKGYYIFPEKNKVKYILKNYSIKNIID